MEEIEGKKVERNMQRQARAHRSVRESLHGTWGEEQKRLENEVAENNQWMRKERTKIHILKHGVKSCVSQEAFTGALEAMLALSAVFYTLRTPAGVSGQLSNSGSRVPMLVSFDAVN